MTSDHEAAWVINTPDQRLPRLRQLDAGRACRGTRCRGTLDLGAPGRRRHRRSRSPSGKPDVALVVNDGPRFTRAGVFTSNRVKAAPIRWCEKHSRRDRARELVAVVLNSGGANACTGPEGYADTVTTAEHLG